MYALLWTQGLYFAATALWPLVHLRSFLKVTGPKTDIWLLNCVSVLILAVGITLLSATRESLVPVSIRVLGFASAAALLTIDLVYVARGTIRKVYLVDALAEALLVLGWGSALLDLN